mmetsp:Transcript_31623/g.94175  ORF Transcript_31623/g.94175 Transcript_31623/m.94175 type:complete len:244 (+) Transcript_31623:1603-2334(+)
MVQSRPAALPDRVDHEVAAPADVLRRLLQLPPVVGDRRLPAPGAEALHVRRRCGRVPRFAGLAEEAVLLGHLDHALHDHGEGCQVGLVRLDVVRSGPDVVFRERRLLVLRQVRVHAGVLPEPLGGLALASEVGLRCRKDLEAGDVHAACRHEQLEDHVLVHVDEGRIPLRRPVLGQVLATEGHLDVPRRGVLVILQILHELGDGGRWQQREDLHFRALRTDTPPDETRQARRLAGKLKHLVIR